MILKYRGYMNNWCYMEAPLITVARLAFEKPVNPDDGDILKSLERQQRHIDGEIRAGVGLCDNETLTYLTGNELFEPERGFVVIVMDNREQRSAFVLYKEAYLLNDNGKTIERII